MTALGNVAFAGNIARVSDRMPWKQKGNEEGVAKNTQGFIGQGRVDNYHRGLH